ncbi:PepSY domain-containing protein [Parendozoicomonas haliclonae]|uniref:Peptidase propeptide and YPEB domain protein n=1 Tax=Parendozoicomonas haliclonae TaxID=1960125 RepID=A0A1X7AHP0_9GAMM|nr:PepSY domain-containing protein [Parendozoicomonas haliclonae]SMA43423.1 Peptidase propeptide and YPEB domain protein [Parendozoicomonas haliclonae]
MTSPRPSRMFSRLLIGSLLATSASLLATLPAHGADTPAKSSPPATSLNEDKTLRLEKVVSIARKAHPGMRILNTFEETENGQEVDKVFYILPDTKQTRIMTINSQTGQILRDRAYSVPERQNSIPLETLLSQLRSKYQMTKIIRTRLAQRDGRDVRIIIYVDKFNQQRLMIVDTKTGEVISDKARKTS